MSNWALAHRPKTFEDVVGQPEKAHLRLLMRDRENFPPVLVFRGPSGTGKTTLARITAMALNCTSLDVSNGDPCTTCPHCVSILNHTFTGVWEHNAALENGADAMRSIVEKTFLYSEGNYNVFILDEVQSLSAQAWKVLLKTFEEPAPGNVFILVTSEASKIPRTIQTRALSYDFGRVAAGEIRTFLDRVLLHEGVELEGLDLIVDLAEGSVRDAVKLAQQCWGSGKTAQELFGQRDTSLALIEGLVEQDNAAIMAALDTMWRSSADAQYIVEKIADQLQRVVHHRYGVEQSCTPGTVARLDRVSNQLGERGLSVTMEVLAQWYPRTRQHAHLLFLLADLGKALRGDKPAQASPARPPVSVKPISTEQASAQLANLDFL